MPASFGSPVQYHSRDVGPGPNGEPAGPVWCPALATQVFSASPEPFLSLVYLEMPYPGATCPAYVAGAMSVPYGDGVNCWRYPPPPPPPQP